MEWEVDSPYCSHKYAWLKRWSPGRCRGWELEFRDCGAIPGRGLLLTVKKQIKGTWGRSSWWEMPREESQAAMEARRFCWVTHREWSLHHGLSLPTCQHWQLNNREACPSNTWSTELQSRTPTQGALLCAWCKIHRAGPHPGPLYVPDAPNNREGPQAREPSKCLKGHSYGERLAKDVFRSPATKGLKKDW